MLQTAPAHIISSHAQTPLLHAIASAYDKQTNSMVPVSAHHDLYKVKVHDYRWLDSVQCV
jgi:hypothetical protein